MPAEPKHEEYIENYFEELKKIISNISREDLDQIIKILFDAWKNENTIFVMGNGGSASTATHLTADLAKTAIVKGKKRFKAIGLTDNIPLMSAWTNDEGFEEVFSGQIENFIKPGDVLISFSVHGGSFEKGAGKWSQNLMRAMQLAKDKGARTIGFSGFDGGAMKQFADACIVVPVHSTPQVEGFHSVLAHLIVFCLKEKITNEGNNTSGW